VKQGILIPLYNHGKTLGPVVTALAEQGLPIIVVDDGSDETTKKCLAQAAAGCPLVVPVNRAKNGGKGRAVSDGIDKAHELGLTHVLQIDADGQHDVKRAGFFLEQSAQHPEGAVCAYPEYDRSIPAGRKNGRVIANTWARITTLSGEITDAMCGFRVYPVEPARRLIHRRRFDRRMGFDIEILIRLYWENVPLIFFPVSVTYPEDGLSHFRLVRDNLRISWVFTRLFFGMLLRLPSLIRRARIRRKGKRP
jgi:glycosyltransferase involved in cell wall biosynthesis